MSDLPRSEFNLPPGVTSRDIERAAAGTSDEIDSREQTVWCPRCGQRTVTYHGGGQRLNSYGGEEDTPAYYACSRTIDCWGVNEYEDEFATYEDEMNERLLAEANEAGGNDAESYAHNAADDMEERAERED